MISRILPCIYLMLAIDSAFAVAAPPDADIIRFDNLVRLPLTVEKQDAPDKAAKSRGWLGISMKIPQVPVKDLQSGASFEAIEIGAVAPGSGAAVAGLQAGDLIVGIDDVPLQSGGDGLQANFRNAITERQLGDVVTLRVMRGNQTTEVRVSLKSYPKGKSILKLHPEFAINRDQAGKSALQQVLEKDALADEYAKLLGAIKRETDKAVSPEVHGEDYNPFRLQEVNYAMYNPMQLPLVARSLTDELMQNYNGTTHDLAALIEIAMNALDIAPKAAEQSKPASPQDMTQYVERVVDAIRLAKSERAAVLSVLDVSEIDFLYATAPLLLEGDSDQAEGEDEEIAKRNWEARLLRFFKIVMRLDLQRLMNASAMVARTVDPDELRLLDTKAIRFDHYPADWKVSEAEGVTTIDTAAGRMLIGGPQDNVYTEDAALIIDLGGNDRYFNQAGGATRNDPYSVVIDLSGDDLYSATSDFAQGAALLGGGFLIDVSGNDRYLAKNYSQGAGVLGVGMLADSQGSDQYSARAESQGAGIFGVGLLADGEGDDTYTGKFFVQGAGYIKGFGAIVEAAGNDSYLAGGLYPDHREPGKAYLSDSQGFGYGLRPDNSFLGTSGGIGVIAEAEGNDTYVADYFSQGASYWFSLGILDDRKGNDRYIAGRYTQGAGIHSSAGILMDGEGDDRYISDFGVSQGCGHDYGVGLLLDSGGDDRYMAGILSQGAGNANGIGMLTDISGNDKYIVRESGQGWGNYEPVTSTGSFGFLFDTDGADTYSSGGNNDGVQYRSRWGVLLDSN